MACLGIVICATGISSREEKSIQLYASEIGAKYSANFTKQITHLIVKKVGSEKHALAQTQNIFCVEMKWLLDSKTSMSRMNEEAYQVLPFTGLNISVSQLEPDERHRITRIVESNGGKFGRNVEKDVTTHLVCLRPEGDKYDAAKSWRNVKIVTAQWIDDCAKKQMWIDERDYPVFPSSSSISSTQTTIPSARSIPPQPSSSTTRAPSKLAPILKRALSKIRRNLREHTQSERDASFQREKSDEALGSKKETNDTWDQDIGQLNHLIPSVPLPQLERHLSPHVVPDALQNDVIFVSGFDDQTTMKIVKVIALGSGFRSAILSEKISKCLLGPKISDRSPLSRSSPDLTLRGSLLHSVVTHPLNPEAVTLFWLLDTVIPSWRSLCDGPMPPPDPLPIPPSPPLPPPLQTLDSGSAGSAGKDSTSMEQESEEIQLRDRLRNSELWSSKVSHGRADGGDEEQAIGLKEFEVREEGEQQENHKNDEDEYEVRDDSEEETGVAGLDEEIDWWSGGKGKKKIVEEGRGEEPRPSKKRTRWEGGGRRKKLSTSQSSTQESSMNPMMLPPSRSRTPLSPPRPFSNGRQRRVGGNSPCAESQLVVYEADTQPPFDPDWL